MTDAAQTTSAAWTVRAPRRALTGLQRLLAHLGGVNPDRLEGGPLDDRQAALRTGLALTTSFLFVTGASAAALAIAFDGAGPATLAVLAPAPLIGAAIALVDHAMIQSHWMEAGLAAARQRGFVPAGANGPMAMLRRAGAALVVAGVRVGLSASLAFSIATVVELSIFHSDIAARIAADQRAANALVLARAQGAVEANLAAAQAEAARLAASLAAVEKRGDALAREVADETAALAAEREARLAQLQQQYDHSDEHAYDQSRRRIAEQYGQRIDGVGTGKPGKGLVYDQADADARLAAARAKALAGEIAALRQAPLLRAADTEALGTARAETATLRAAHDAAIAERDRRAAARAADVHAALVADPAYVPVADGLVTRLGAMRELEASPSVLAFTLAIKGLLMMLEMAGLIAKLLVAAPGRYGLFQALDFESDAAVAIEAAAERIDSFAEGAEQREERAEERRDSRDRRRRRRHVAAGARERFASTLRDAVDEARRP